MRVIKLGIISVIVFSLLLTGISLFFPSHVRISKAVDINANRDSMLTMVKDAANWKKWYPGADTLELLMINGRADGLILNRERGTMRISSCNDTAVIATTGGPGIKSATTGWNFYPSRTPATTTVQWYMDFHLRWYPWEKLSSLLLEKRYGPVMEKGLGNLKTLLEK